MNNRINLTEIVSSLYPNVRRTVLLSLVGSANATIFNAADTIVRSLLDQGHDVTRMEQREVEQLLRGPDESENERLNNLRQLYAVRTEWADMLAQDTGDDKLGSMESTIELLTGKQKLRPTDPAAIEMLKAAGEEVTEADLKAAAIAKREDDQFWADQRKERSAQTEWFIDRLVTMVPNSDGLNDAYTTNEPDGDQFMALDDETKERLYNKFIASLNNGLKKARQNVLTGRAGPQDLGLADIPVLRDLAARFTAAVWPIKGLPTTNTVDPAKVKALATKFRRAPAPTEDALI